MNETWGAQPITIVDEVQPRWLWIFIEDARVHNNNNGDNNNNNNNIALERARGTGEISAEKREAPPWGVAYDFYNLYQMVPRGLY